VGWFLLVGWLVSWWFGWWVVWFIIGSEVILFGRSVGHWFVGQMVSGCRSLRWWIGRWVGWVVDGWVGATFGRWCGWYVDGLVIRSVGQSVNRSFGRVLVVWIVGWSVVQLGSMLVFRFVNGLV
jgi:hypothetical protein